MCRVFVCTASLSSSSCGRCHLSGMKSGFAGCGFHPRSSSHSAFRKMSFDCFQASILTIDIRILHVPSTQERGLRFSGLACYASQLCRERSGRQMWPEPALNPRSARIQHALGWYGGYGGSPCSPPGSLSCPTERSLPVPFIDTHPLARPTLPCPVPCWVSPRWLSERWSRFLPFSLLT